jgi:hypothetical protein
MAHLKKQISSVALVRKRIIQIERKQLVGDVMANFYGIEGVAWSAQRIPTAVFSAFLDQNIYFFYQVASQLYSRG